MNKQPLIHYLKPIVDERTKKGLPTHRQNLSNKLLADGVEFDHKDNRSLVCTMADHTINIAKRKGRPEDKIKYFWRLGDDSWISLEFIREYENKGGFKINMSPYVDS